MKTASRRMAEDVDQVRERQAWAAFAGPRFDLGSDRERSLHHLLRRKVEAAFGDLFHGARRSGVRLDFDSSRLLLAVVEALDQPCVYCSALLAVDDFAVVYDVPPGGRAGAAASRGLANVAVPCASCGEAKGPLSGNEWRDVVAALRAADELAAQSCVAALALGYKQRPILARRKGTPSGGPAASNARGGV